MRNAFNKAVSATKGFAKYTFNRVANEPLGQYILAANAGMYGGLGIAAADGLSGVPAGRIMEAGIAAAMFTLYAGKKLANHVKQRTFAANIKAHVTNPDHLKLLDRKKLLLAVKDALSGRAARKPKKPTLPSDPHSF